jgi:hypothetical protein
LLLLRDLLLELALRLLPLALGLLLRLELEPLRLLLLPPLEAVPRLLPELLREEDEPDFEEEEELRDAIACSLGWIRPPLVTSLRPHGQSRQMFRGHCRRAPVHPRRKRPAPGVPSGPGRVSPRRPPSC